MRSFAAARTGSRPRNSEFIVRLYRRPNETHREVIPPELLLQGGTSVGADIREALRGQSRLDLQHKKGHRLKRDL